MTTTPDITSSTAFKLHRATVLIDRIADDYLTREHGIHYAPFLVLLMVRVLGEPSQQAIARNLDVSRASVTQRVSGLVESGLLEVTPDPADSRANIVRLTTPGAALVESAWRGLEQHQSGLDAGVDEPALVAQLDRIISNAEEALS
ncbi:MAG: MarR family winged helix-turn-helix transcriptional regulator [Actinobacteria bacterium]|nr:MarR family winged helix-turn-helix transcriptional regulator [Actinomycetota bacterium]